MRRSVGLSLSGQSSLSPLRSGKKAYAVAPWTDR
jgi:hypothetical protein